MKLRNFLYLNTKLIEDYIAAIDGYTYDEESQSIAKSTENSFGGKAGIPIMFANGTRTGRQDEEIKRSVIISDAAKFDRIYSYLQSSDGSDNGLKYYELLSEEIYNDLRRDDFIEVLVTARFSKMKELTDSVKGIVELAAVIQGLTNQQILDNATTDAINGFSLLEQLQSGKEISCVFDFDDGKYPIVAHLDESCFRCKQDSFVGQSYMLCKIIRKIPKGQSMKLDEIFDGLKKLPLNREQRRTMPKNMSNPDMIRDVIKGPALMVLPVAVYQ